MLRELLMGLAVVFIASSVIISNIFRSTRSDKRQLPAKNISNKISTTAGLDVPVPEPENGILDEVDGQYLILFGISDTNQIRIMNGLFGISDTNQIRIMNGANIILPNNNPSITACCLIPNTVYKVTVTTRNAAGTAIDGPTASTINTIKQIATGQIADSAVTTPKIAVNAIVPELFTLFGDPVNVPPQALESSLAFCPDSRLFAVGGGFTVEGGSEPFMHASDSRPFGVSVNVWEAFVYNSHPTLTFEFQAVAKCMAPMP